MSELDELRLEAYESTNVYKERIKRWHNKHIVKKRLEEDNGSITKLQVEVIFGQAEIPMVMIISSHKSLSS